LRLKNFKEIKNLRDKLGNFVGGYEALNKLLRCKETPKTNLVMVSKAKRLCMVKKSLFAIFVEKWVMRLISAATSLKRATHQRVYPVLISTHKLTKKKTQKDLGT